MKATALRLTPGDDLKEALTTLTKERALKAGIVLTCVGSLAEASLRFAGQDETTTLSGPFEILSLVGTLSPEGLHLHIALADKEGRTVGGHVQVGCTVYTTAELVIGELSGVQFLRTFDTVTGYEELEIRHETGEEKG